MATRKTTRKPARKSARKSEAAGATGVLKQTWEAALRRLSAAEAELEKQVRDLMTGGIGAEAVQTVRHLRSRLDRERRRLGREVESRVASLQARVQKERRSLTRLVDETVTSALAALNIPSRQEIAELTRKVDELSRKIDGFSAPAPRRRAVRRSSTPAQA